MAAELPHSPPFTPKLHATDPATPPQTPPPPPTHSPTSPPPSASTSARRRGVQSTAEQLVDRLRQRARGHHERESDAAAYTEISITPSALKDALWQLEQQHHDAWLYFQHKERFSYDSATQILTLRMPGRIHEVIISALTRIIEGHVEATVREHEDAMRIWSKDIYFGGSTTVALQETRQSPDASWYFGKAALPTVTLEVAFSETSEHVHSKCEDLVNRSLGQVRTAIVVKCPYVPAIKQAGVQSASTEKAPAASISIFRYHLDLLDGTYEVVCDPHEALSSPLRLRLADFIPYAMTLERRELQTLSDTIGDITIPAESLEAKIDEAYRLSTVDPVEHLNEAMQQARPKKRQRAEDDGEADEQRTVSRSATTSFETATDDAADRSYCPPRSSQPNAGPAMPQRRHPKRLRTEATAVVAEAVVSGSVNDSTQPPQQQLADEGRGSRLEGGKEQDQGQEEEQEEEQEQDEDVVERGIPDS